jgi:sec-independent protein translocase protein TatA
MEFYLPSVAFIEGLGGGEMMLIFVIVLMLFGGDKLPDFARGLGKSIREFKKAASGVEEEFKRALEEDAHKKSAPPPPPTTFPAYPPVATLAEPAAAEQLALDAAPAATDSAVPIGNAPAEVVSTDAPATPPDAPAAAATPEPEKPAKPPVVPPEPSAESYAPRSADLLP